MIVNSFPVSSIPSHPAKKYMSSGVAVIVIDVPSSYVPPSVEMDPPSPAVTVKVYWVGSGSCSAAWTADSPVEFSSLEQHNIITNKKRNDFLIIFINDSQTLNLQKTRAKKGFLKWIYLRNHKRFF